MIENQRLIGIDEVGHFTGDHPAGPFTNTSWGNTTQDGVQVQLTTERAELQSGQARMLESVSLVRASMSMVMALVVAELQVFQRLWGLATSTLTGDLAATPTPTEEILEIGESDLGTREDRIYIQGPGPGSTRTVRAYRSLVSDLGGMAFASNAFQTPGATWEVLNTEDSNPPIAIYDAP